MILDGHINLRTMKASQDLGRVEYLFVVCTFIRILRFYRISPFRFGIETIGPFIVIVS